MIFVSHRLARSSRLADRVTVLRDGHSVGGGLVTDFDRRSLIELMVGRALENFDATHDRRRASATRPCCACATTRSRAPSRHLARRRAGRDRRARRARRRRPLRAARGDLRPAPRARDASSSTASRSPSGAPARRSAPALGFVPADRKRQGLVQQMSVRDNLMMASTSRLRPLPHARQGGRGRDGGAR